MDRRSQNWAIRIRLAAAYRGLHAYGLNEGIGNHLSAIAPGAETDGDVMLLIPSGFDWDEVTPSLLVGVNKDNEVVEGFGAPDKGAVYLHRGVYNARPDLKCVMHTHMTYATVLTTLDEPGFLMLHQNSARFHDRLAYDDDYDGILETVEDGEQLGKHLGDKCVLLLRSHGALTTSDSIDIAFDDMYFLERAAATEVLARSMASKLKPLPDHIVKRACAQLMKDLPIAAKTHLDAIVRRYSHYCSEFKVNNPHIFPTKFNGDIMQNDVFINTKGY